MSATKNLTDAVLADSLGVTRDELDAMSDQDLAARMDRFLDAHSDRRWYGHQGTQTKEVGG